MIFSTHLYSQVSTNEKPISFSYPNVEYKGTIYYQPPIDMDKIAEEDIADEDLGNPPRFGYPIRVNYNLENSGQWTLLSNGDRLWRMEIISPQALSINLLYDKFWLPKGAKLFVYDKEKKHYIGAFTDKNNKGSKDEIRGFATGLIYSDDIMVEYYIPKNVIDTSILSISYVVHGYRYIADILGLGASLTCQVNVNCKEGYYYQNEKKAIAMILVDGSRCCTGSLINTIFNDNRPYLLTANHCLQNRDAILNPLLDYYSFVWKYESPDCNNLSTEPEIYSTTGATVLANNDESSCTDFALLCLDEDPRDIQNMDLYYLGWDNSGYSTNNCVGIHHPKGDLKKISTINGYPMSYSVNNHIFFWRVYWDQTLNGYSITEIGSSGSPLLNKDKRIIGQLYSGYSPGCNSTDNYSIYGKFNISWTGNSATINQRKLQPWLDPNNTATLLNGIGNVSCRNGENLLHNDIMTDEEISNISFGTGLIFIHSGSTLTISSTLRMAPGSKIIVEPGAKLVVNGGEIIGACGEYWDGIRVEGNKNLPQTETNQGVVELNNALISDAIDGISAIGENGNWEKTGGIIKATNTIFKNNRRSIEFMSYGENTNTNSASYFRNCTFTWDDDLLPNESTSLSHITMYQVRGVEVSGCTFKDERTDIPSSTHGLLTLESGFNVNNYNTTDAQFNNLTFGIKTDNSGTRICSIENAEFTDNYCGINATTSNNLVITNNSFNISPKTFTVGGISNLHVEAEALGAFVETSSLPTIENNAFVGTGKTYSLVGLQVKNLGTNNTIINNNSFSGLYAGTQALGYNRGVTQGFIIKGLQYKCNSFLNCSKGIFVTSYGESLSNLFSGIHPNQGSSTQINNNFFALNNDNDIYNLVPYTLTYYYYRISPRNCVGITLTSTTTPGTPCGTIGVTEPTDLLTNNTLGANVLSLIDEENNIDNVGNKTIFDTINEYIEDGQYNTAKTRLQNMEITSENRNEVEDYISYINKIEEYGNSYKIPDNDLIELSTHTTQVGKRASAMVYFKNINREYLPRVVREDEETSSDSSMQNKIQEQITEKGIEITEEYILTPNPANNEVEIKTTNRGKTTEQHIIPTENTIRQVVILDLQGKELKTFDNTTTFNITFLKNGTYIVKIKDSENKLHYQKLIKQ